MKIAVSGGFGFLGSQVTKQLEKNGYEVVPFSRRTGVDIRYGDQIHSFLRNTKPDMVVNCQVEKVFPVHLFLCGYAVPYIPGHMPDQNLG